MNPIEIANLIAEDISINNGVVDDNDDEIIRKELVYLRDKLEGAEFSLIQNKQSVWVYRLQILIRIHDFAIKHNLHNLEIIAQRAVEDGNAQPIFNEIDKLLR